MLVKNITTIRRKTWTKKTRERKYIVLLKYIYMIVFISFALMTKKLTGFQVMLLLLYIIVNQIRFFILAEKSFVYYTSYIVEFGLSCIIYGFLAEYRFLVFIPAFIDITTSLPNTISSIYFVSILISSYFISNSIDDMIMSLSCTFPILVLGSIIRDEYEEKINAQNLYDKLRQREEELKKANKDLESYANTIEEITLLRERNRISREIHDNVGHALSTIMIQLAALSNIIPLNPKKAIEMSDNLAKFTDDSLQNVRAAVRSMKPREFEEYEGLVSITEMVKNFEKLSGIRVNLRFSDKFWSLNSDQTMVIYRLIQEFLSNSIRHGKATEVNMFLNFMERSLRIYMKDNGIGCSKIHEGVGLKSIRERVKVWGGNMEYYSKEGEGFEIAATIERDSLGMGVI